MNFALNFGFETPWGLGKIIKSVQIEQLMILDQTIMRFVKNPHQKPNTIEVTQATQARQDLEAVIELTSSLRKVASRLEKAATAKGSSPRLHL